ncbi:MAG TPA: 16S rRNA (guanine(966)-N(2))-methyltransferase RsmD [Gaiellaceae bacterium]|nr:16S rRNA (guanine(966)-N(2))-methyltransferase RsmD [Gaiellaceae bacterium]
MRIVAGSRRGQRIEAPRGAVTRPTSDRVREAAFALIGPLEGASVLDLFAGSGALGLEALSRGAASCLFVERDRAACRVVEENLARLGLPGGRVRRADAIQALRSEARAGRRYELVLVDPPYEEWARYERPLGRLLPAVLADRALVLVETEARVEPALPLDLVTTRRYGSARLTLFRAP